jgi:hypothetical protein
MGTGNSFPGGKARLGSDADHSPHLVSRLRMGSCIYSLSWRLHGGSGTALLYFYYVDNERCSRADARNKIQKQIKIATLHRDRNWRNYIRKKWLSRLYSLKFRNCTDVWEVNTVSIIRLIHRLYDGGSTNIVSWKPTDVSEVCTTSTRLRGATSQKL